MTLDVTSEPDWIGVIEQTVEFFGKLDILVNNAGIYSRVPIENTSVEEFDRILEVNLRGVFLGTKHAIPAMRTSGGDLLSTYLPQLGSWVMWVVEHMGLPRVVLGLLQNIRQFSMPTKE